MLIISEYRFSRGIAIAMQQADSGNFQYVYDYYYYYYYYYHFTVPLDFVRVYPGEPVPGR